MNGAQSLLQTLVNGGIEVCFTNPGTSEMHFVAALDRVSGMRAVLGLFEGVCTGAADGYARMTGKPAATLLHLGPGLGNGFANLHNARRGLTPMVNIVGDHATYHLKYDAPLTSDIVGVASPVSGWVRSSASADTISKDAAEAIEAANRSPGQIATLILPADTAWTETSAPLAAVSKPSGPSINQEAVEHVAGVLRSGEPTLLLMSGAALLETGLRLASQVAAGTGAALMSNRPSARVVRGAGRPMISRLPYPVPMAVQQLEKFAHIVLVGTQPPVSFFAYPNSPSWLAPPDCQFHTLATEDEDLVGALQALVETMQLPDQLHAVYEMERPATPTGELTAGDVWRGVAALMPAEAILADESITSSFGAEAFLSKAPRFDMLTGTGGAIGGGMPMATGAAVAAPGRRVINTQADGSAMYTIQSLWTQAREQLDVVTILFNNRAYRILQGEFQRVGADPSAAQKAQSVMSLDQPQLNFAEIARGLGVEGTRATTGEELTTQLQGALGKSGPHLIEVLVP